MRFFLGTHVPSWLYRQEFCGVPLFISRRTLGKIKAPKLALTEWALDSGGFSELRMFGGWKTSAEQYAEEVAGWISVPGNLQWAAPQDWMCEPDALLATKLTIVRHQELTVKSYLDLVNLAPGLPWIPVLQGQGVGDYVAHAEMYQRSGVDLSRSQVVGVGSVCRRQATSEIGEVVKTLAGAGLRLHGFGVKKDGLRKYGKFLVSSDSLAWSASARRSKLLLPGHTGHINCANCPVYAKQWYQEVRRITDESA